MTTIVHDWLRDPLVEVVEEERQLCKFSHLSQAQQREWEDCHAATRLKLEGATYHFRIIAGSVSLPGNLDDSRQMWWAILKWHLDAFFFELMSAFDCLLQEVNVHYQLGLEEEDVKWRKLKECAENKGVTLTVLADIEQARQQDQFKKIVKYRNMVTHRTIVPVLEGYIISNRPAVQLGSDKAEMYTPEGKTEPLVESCLAYLRFMINLIWKVWNTLKREQ